jgi:OOP family OmpA-OmpF porin
VARYLIEQGVNAQRIQFKGYGETQPIASNETEQGRAKNRRIEMKIINL